MSIAHIILSILSICFIFISILIFFFIFFLIYKSRQELQDVSILLICNSCLASLLTCLTIGLMISSNLKTKFLIKNLRLCYACGLLYDIFECSIYYSYCIQAIYRLCRIIFYHQTFMISYIFYIILTISHWLLVLALLLPPIFFKWYVRLQTENYCLIPYDNITGEIYHIVIVYTIPLICISVTYAWIIQFIRYSSRTLSISITTRQRQRNLNDLTIVENIVISISILVLLRFPTIIFMIHGILIGEVYYLTYSIVGLITAICLLFISLITIYTIQPLKKKFIFMFCHRRSYIHTKNSSMDMSQTPVTKINITEIVSERPIVQHSNVRY